MSKKPMESKEESRKIVYKGTQEVNHHLYRLTLSHFERNISYSKQRPIFEKIPHTHVFHSVDSNGKKQDRSHKVGGHFHIVETIPSENGEWPLIKVSKAMHLVRERDQYGNETIIAQEIPHDQHTHDWEYITTERFKVRKANLEAVKVQAAIQARVPMSVDGIQG